MNKTFVMVLLAGASMASCSSEDDIIGQEPTLADNRREKSGKYLPKEYNGGCVKFGISVR